MDVVIDLVSKKMLLVISPNERELERIQYFNNLQKIFYYKSINFNIEKDMCDQLANYIPMQF